MMKLLNLMRRPNAELEDCEGCGGALAERDDIAIVLTAVALPM
jgi:hypothetical protein